MFKDIVAIGSQIPDFKLVKELQESPFKSLTAFALNGDKLHLVRSFQDFNPRARLD